MSKSTKDAIKEAIAEQQAQQQTPPNWEAPPTGSPSNSDDFKGALNSARQKMKLSAKSFILGGITDAIAEIQQGDLGTLQEDLVFELEAFEEGIVPPKLQVPASRSELFALPGEIAHP